MLIYTQVYNLPGRYSNEVFPIHLLLVLEEKDMEMGIMNLALYGFSSKNFQGRTTSTQFLVVAI